MSAGASVADRQEPLDPLWLIAFPIYYGFMALYGLFASIYYLPSIRSAANDPALAQLFGVLIAIACAFGVVGALVSIFKDRLGIEFISALTIVALMLFYALTLSFLVGVAHDPGTRPGSTFVPIVFGVFPAIRAAVIVRRWAKLRQQAEARSRA